MAETSNPTGPSVVTRKVDEKKRTIALVGHVSHQIVGAKLPSNRQVLEVFFYNMRFVNLTAKDSAALTIEAVLIFWKQARIPTRDPHKCAEKLTKLHQKWQSVTKKSLDEMGAALKQTYDVFIDELDDLFDIARADALTTMKIKEDQEFLIKQRQKGRPGSMLGIDMKLSAKEDRTELRKKKEEERQKREDERVLNYQKASKSQQSGW